MGNDVLEMAKTAAVATLARRAEDAKILDLRALGGFTDFFVISSGNSNRQVEGISEKVIEDVEEKWNQRPWHREGPRKGDWILLDYVDFVVHIFLHEKRKAYDLERLWSEALEIELPTINPNLIEDDYELDDDPDDFELDDFIFDEGFEIKID